MLQALFPDPIEEQKNLDPGYSGHASDVWLVRTATEEAVVRTSRLIDEPDNEFWRGLKGLFGIDPRRVGDLEPVNGYLCALSSIPVPRVLRVDEVGGRVHAVVEKMKGSTLPSFGELAPEALAGLGEALARIHTRRFDWCGAPSGALQYPVAEFHTRLIGTIWSVVDRYYREQPEIEALLEPICLAAQALPAPEAGALVMPDLDPSQFLWNGERITALVDTEAYVVGPRELDLIALEYVLDAPQAQAVAEGYRRVLPLPDLTAVRPVYRYFYRLLRIQGQVPMERWMNWPVLFGQ